MPKALLRELGVRRLRQGRRGELEAQDPEPGKKREDGRATRTRAPEAITDTQYSAVAFCSSENGDGLCERAQIRE